MIEPNKNNPNAEDNLAISSARSNNTEKDAVIVESHSKEKSSPTPPGMHGDQQEKSENFGLEILKIVVLAIIIVTPVRLFIAQPFIVEGASMDYTFASGEYLIVDQLSYRFTEPERNDVIVFRFPLEPSKFFIKRIIGLPNDKIVMQGNTTTIINEENPEGFIIDESYLSPENVEHSPFTITLEDDEYFVLGDNRRKSYDSRAWGTLDRDSITGRVFIRLFPITKLNLFPGK